MCWHEHPLLIGLSLKKQPYKAAAKHYIESLESYIMCRVWKGWASRSHAADNARSVIGKFLVTYCRQQISGIADQFCLKALACSVSKWCCVNQVGHRQLMKHSQKITSSQWRCTAAVMALVVGFLSLAAEELWLVLPTSAYFASVGSFCIAVSCIFFGGAIAFAMVWTEFSVIQETSALTFMVAGTFKEIVTGDPLQITLLTCLVSKPVPCTYSIWYVWVGLYIIEFKF